MRYFTVDEVAEILRLSKSTIYGLVHERRITHRKHGTRLAFTAEDIHSFSKAGEVRSIEIGASIRCPKRIRSARPTTRGSLKTEQNARGKPSPDLETRDG